MSAAPPTDLRAPATLRAADTAALAALRSGLADARESQDDRPPLAVVAELLTDLGVAIAQPRPSASLVRTARDEWLRRVASAGRSESAVRAYRNAIDDFVQWAEAEGRGAELFEEPAIVNYLDNYRRRCAPAPATYHRRFLLLRRYMRWLSQRASVPDPFADLETPPRPCQEADWLTPQEFVALLAAAKNPPRRLSGLAERDRLVLLGLVVTGLRRAELIAVNWGDLTLDGDLPSVLVRCGKGAKPRRQPLPSQLAEELRQRQMQLEPEADEPVFCGLKGGRLQPTILANIIGRTARRAKLAKHVTAHTLRHTAATWLRQATGDARLVAEYLGHADLSTVSRYAHVARPELHAAARELAQRAGGWQAEGMTGGSISEVSGSVVAGEQLQLMLPLVGDR